MDGWMDMGFMYRCEMESDEMDRRYEYEYVNGSVIFFPQSALTWTCVYISCRVLRVLQVSPFPQTIRPS